MKGVDLSIKAILMLPIICQTSTVSDCSGKSGIEQLRANLKAAGRVSALTWAAAGAAAGAGAAGGAWLGGGTAVGGCAGACPAA